MLSQAVMLAESPTVKAAMDTYQAEARLIEAKSGASFSTRSGGSSMNCASRIHPDIIAVTDPMELVVAAAGRRRSDWPRSIPPTCAGAEFVATPGGIFRVATAPLLVQQTPVGYLQLGTALDGDYATQITSLSEPARYRVEGRRRGQYAAGRARRGRDAAIAGRARPTPTRWTSTASSTPCACCLRHGDLAIYTLDSIEASARAILGTTVRALAASSPLLARGRRARQHVAGADAGAADRHAVALARRARGRRATSNVRRAHRVQPRGRRADRHVQLADGDRRRRRSRNASAYVGAIRALALALDARDPYTAGHSERVSTISVTVGHQIGLDDDDLDTLRLGALLHDIGKIGISDDVLRKAGPLTPLEYQAIKQHPVTGARILRSVAFLARHLPIVELHHERPDGKGYPYGLHRRRDPCPRAHRPCRGRVRCHDQRARLPSSAQRRRGLAGVVALRRFSVRCRRRPGARRRCADAAVRSRTNRHASCRATADPRELPAHMNLPRAVTAVSLALWMASGRRRGAGVGCPRACRPTRSCPRRCSRATTGPLRCSMRRRGSTSAAAPPW